MKNEFTPITLTAHEIDLIFKLRREEKRNPNYVLWNFDDNMEKVLNTGYEMMDRTGTGCKYLPGITSVVDISKRIPIPTRRATKWKSMLNEYLWFLTGSDKIDDLNKMGSKVWDFWRDEKWATENGFEPSSIGYGYGPNLIHSGGDLKDLKNNPGVNQIDYVINELKTNPTSRRILFDFWRADKSKNTEVRLNPCHVIYQFIVEPNKNGEMNNLTCVMYQRSCDSLIGGLSTNLAGATFYTYMLAQQVGMVPNKLIHCSGHFHLYNNHIPFLKEYLNREAPNSPILKLNKKNSIYEYTADDFQIEDYNPLQSMKIPIAV